VGERIIDGALFRLALVPVEIGLKLLFGFDGVGYKFALRPKGQFANITVRRAGSAPDESDNDELSVRHRDIMAGRRRKSQMRSPLGSAARSAFSTGRPARQRGGQIRARIPIATL